MSDPWQASVVLITSNDLGESHFGTGFVIDQDEQTTCLLTCAHVVRDVGGHEKIGIDGTQARVIASSPEEGADLAVLRIERLLDMPPLPLYAAGEKGKPFSTAGFQFDGKQFLIRELHGTLGEQVWIQMRGQADRIRAWDLEITDRYLLQPGYSGSPIVDEYGHVIGVVNTRRGDGKTGVAISIEALKKVWPSGPRDLVKQSGVGIKEKGVSTVGSVSPDQREGDVASVPFFPNLAGERVPAPSPSPRTRRSTRFSRRTVIAGLCVLTTLGGVGGLTLLTHNYSSGLVAPSPSTNAPMFGFDPQRTHFNPNEQILSVKNVSTLVPYWTTLDIGAIWGCSPVVADSLVYVTGKSYLYAFHASTGASAWTRLIPDSIAFIPTVANGRVYIGSNSGHLYVFNASTGVPTLTILVSSSPVLSSPVVVNGVVYVGSIDGKLYAFSASTGAPAWNAPAITGGIVSSSPAVSDNVVYVGSIDGKLYAFSASTGAPAWNAPAITGDQIGSTPAVANDLVYIATDNGKLYAFHTSTGAPAWNASLGNKPAFSPTVSSPAVALGTVFIGSADQQLYAINAYTGALFWSFATGGSVLSSPTVANGVVYVGSGYHIYAFAINNGSLLWSATTDDQPIYSSPIVADGVVYICADDGKLHTFHLSSATP